MSPLAEQLRLVLPQSCVTEAEDVSLTRPGVPLAILVSDLSTWSLRAVYDLSAVNQRHFRNFQI